MPFVLDLTTSVSLLALLSYVLFYVLFLIAQLWWAFALVFSALYFIPLIAGLQLRHKWIFAISLIAHIIGTLALAGWSIFFFVEIFKIDQVESWLYVYLKNAANARDVARNAAIAMTVDGFLTSTLMLVSVGFLMSRARKIFSGEEEDEYVSEGSYPRVPSGPPRGAGGLYLQGPGGREMPGTIARHTEQEMMSVQPIPRLRTTSTGNITASHGHSYASPTTQRYSVVSARYEPRRYSIEERF